MSPNPACPGLVRDQAINYTRFSGVEESRSFIVGSEPGLPENVPALGPLGLIALAGLLGVAARRRLRG